MRQGMTVVPAGLVLAVALLGAGEGSAAPPAHGVAWLDDRFGTPVAPIYLLLRPDVQRDLNLSRHQIAGAEKQVRRLVERLFGLKDKAGDAAMAAKRDIDEMMAAWLHKELLADQLERLTQINFQWEGASALHRQSVAEYLVLREQQRLGIEHLLSDRNRRRAAGTLAPGEFDKLSGEALNLLDAVQKQAWNELLGPPCRFVIGRPVETGSAPRSPAHR